MHPDRVFLNRLQREAAGKIRLGLDLQGGTSFLVSMETNNLTQGPKPVRRFLRRSKCLRKRVDRFGVAEP